MDHEPISWEAFEYTPKRRTADWYWAVGIVTIAIAVISLFFGNLLFAVFIVLAALTLCLYAIRPPEIINYQLDDKGVRIEKRLYPYETLESFWVEDDTLPEPKIIFKSRKMLMPFVVLHLHDDLHRNTLRTYLRQFLEEVQHAEPLSHKLMDYLGF